MKTQSGEVSAQVLPHSEFPQEAASTLGSRNAPASQSARIVSTQFSELEQISTVRRAASDISASHTANETSAKFGSASLGETAVRSDRQISPLSQHSGSHTRVVDLPQAAVSTSGEAPPDFKALARMVDIRTLLSRANDEEFLAPLQGDDGKLAGMSTKAADLQAMLNGTDIAAPTELKEAISARLDQVMQSLDELNTNKSIANRAAKIVTINALLAPLSLLVPMFSKPPQQMAEAELIALNFKAIIEAIGMMFTPTTGNLLLKDRAMSRYYANTVQAVLFALPTFVKSMRPLNSNMPFNAALGVISTGALFAGFMSKEIKGKINMWRSGDRYPAMMKAGQELFSPNGILSEEQQNRVREVMNRILGTLNADQKSLLNAKESFAADRTHAISPHVSKQVSIAVSTYQQITEELSSLLGMHASKLATENKDRNAKLALALFATVVCAATTVLMAPDKIGMVDLGSDAAFTSALMFSLAANANVSRNDALEEFKTFVGLSIVMLAVLAANKGANDFMEKGPMGLLVGSIAMTGLNLILPGPIGHAAGSGLEKLMNLNPSDLLATLRGIGNKVYQMFGGARAETPPHQSNVVIKELGEGELGNLESGLPA